MIITPILILIFSYFAAYGLIDRWRYWVRKKARLLVDFTDMDGKMDISLKIEYCKRSPISNASANVTKDILSDALSRIHPDEFNSLIEKQFDEE